METQSLIYRSCRSLLGDTTSDAFDKALCLALTTFDPLPKNFGHGHEGLSARQREALIGGGLTLELKPTTLNPLAQTAIEFATIIEHSLTPKEAGERLGVTTSCIRRMIANRSLYSFLINRTRHIPDFQLTKNKNRLIPGIDKVNQALKPGLHPVAVYNWLHYPHTDLFLNDDMDQTVSPLEWLKRGKKPDLVEQLARRRL